MVAAAAQIVRSQILYNESVSARKKYERTILFLTFQFGNIPMV